MWISILLVFNHCLIKSNILRPKLKLQVDMFTWRHPDFLSVLAAGNNAINSTTNTDQFVLDEFGLLPGGTVQSPASAKNVLAVGSVYNYVPPGPGSPLIATFTATNSSTGKTYLNYSFSFYTVTIFLSHGFETNIFFPLPLKHILHLNHLRQSCK